MTQLASLPANLDREGRSAARPPGAPEARAECLPEGCDILLWFVDAGASSGWHSLEKDLRPCPLEIPLELRGTVTPPRDLESYLAEVAPMSLPERLLCRRSRFENDLRRAEERCRSSWDEYAGIVADRRQRLEALETEHRLREMEKQRARNSHATMARGYAERRPQAVAHYHKLQLEAAVAGRLRTRFEIRFEPACGRLTVRATAPNPGCVPELNALQCAARYSATLAGFAAGCAYLPFRADGEGLLAAVDAAVIGAGVDGRTGALLDKVLTSLHLSRQQWASVAWTAPQCLGDLQQIALDNMASPSHT